MYAEINVMNANYIFDSKLLMNSVLIAKMYLATKKIIHYKTINKIKKCN